MKNVTAIIKNIRDIMRQDKGISGDAQRLEQLGWMLFLKIMDDKDLELEILKDDYQSVIPEKFQWRNWAANPEGISGNELLHFIDSNSEKDKGLFSSLKELSSTTNPERAFIVKEVFDGSNNYMKSGYEMRKVINKLNEIDFNNKDDKHIFGDIYESILKELQAAGNKGEFYTPNAVTKLMTTMIDPKLGEKVLDPAAGTGGFLTMAIDHVREKYVRTVSDEKVLQKSIKGWELKPVAYVLGLTNLIIHGIDVPNFVYKDSLKTEYNGIGSKDRIDVILANPPFGASIADGVETNFPQTFRCKESADLFVVLMMQLLKQNGRAAIVLPDGSISGGTGINGRIMEKLLQDFNLHTVIKMPQTTFFPATVNTNLLFFIKGEPTKEIWYYEHKLPEGQKSYSKKKPIDYDEFQPIVEWWNNRTENDIAWKVKVNDLKDWNLAIKNPTKVKLELGDPKEHIKSFKDYETNFENTLTEIINEIGISDNKIIFEIVKNHKYLFKKNEIINLLKNYILQEAVKGRLTKHWRTENRHMEPVSELLKKIKGEKIKIRKMKKEKDLPLITKEEIPFEIPKNWVWCRITELFTTLSSKNKQVKSKNYLQKGMYPIVDQGKKLVGGFSNNKEKLVSIQDPVIIFGDHTREVKYVDFDFIPGADGTQILSPFRPLNTKYFYLVLRSINIDSNGYSRHFKFLKEKLFPIPSILEQKEIVKKVEKLMMKCEKLEQEIIKSETKAQALMQAALQEAFNKNNYE